jgi:glycosyltransferase involved in cell wall biosynthesis
MNILVSSPVFAPSVGGAEIVTEILARAFADAAHEVCVITRTRCDQPDAYPFRVVRGSSPRRLFREVARTDIFVHSGLSLYAVWPLLFLHRPWVVISHIWLGAGLRARIKRRLIRWSWPVCVSSALAQDFCCRAVVIPNPYRAEIFRPIAEVPRDRNFVFVGRLIPDKGADVALEALAILRRRSIHASLTLIGSGPSEHELRTLTHDLDIGEQVTFTGPLPPDAVARELNRHQVLIVPSRWQEPFGVVALEGIACGCVVLGSSSGGLKEAIGPCGCTVPNGDAKALAQEMEKFVTAPDTLQKYREPARAHLEKHQPPIVAAAYLALFTQASASRAVETHPRVSRWSCTEGSAEAHSKHPGRSQQVECTAQRCAWP